MGSSLILSHGMAAWVSAPGSDGRRSGRISRQPTQSTAHPINIHQPAPLLKSCDGCMATFVGRSVPGWAIPIGGAGPALVLRAG